MPVAGHRAQQVKADVEVNAVQPCKGEELGHFLSRSTLVVLASGPFSFSPNVAEGSTVRMGQPLLRRTLNGITHGREQ